MIDSRDTWTIWICVDCMQALANGELCDDADREPLSALDADAEVTCGLIASEHECDSLDDCNGECERQEFSWSRCEGCGSNLGGERLAATEWERV